MAGFGKPQRSQDTKHNANNINIEEAIRQSLNEYQQGKLMEKGLLDKAIEVHQVNSVLEPSDN